MGLALAACGAQRPWTDSAQIALNTGAHALAAVDAVAAARYRLDAADAGALAPLEARYAPVLAAERVASAALHAAESELAIARANPSIASECRAAAAIVDSAGTATSLAIALRAAGLAVPPEVDAVAAVTRDVTLAVAPACADAGVSR